MFAKMILKSLSRGDSVLFYDFDLDNKTNKKLFKKETPKNVL